MGLAKVIKKFINAPSLISSCYGLINICHILHFFSDSKSKYTEDDIITMLEFLVNNIFVVFVGKVFQQIIGIPMGTNCAPLLADIFLYSYEAEVIQSLPSAGNKQLASQLQLQISIHR